MCNLERARCASFLLVDLRVMSILRWTRHGFWQRLARMLDDYLVDRAKGTVPAAAFRRSRHEIERCRRLMRKGSLTPAHSKVAYAATRRAARAAPPSC